MALVGWICALAGAGLAFGMLAGSASGLTRRMDLVSALAVLPLPALAIYFTAPDLYVAIQAGRALRELVFPGGPLVIGVGTLLMVAAAVGSEKR
jgi:hypothetical protein